MPPKPRKLAFFEFGSAIAVNRGPDLTREDCRAPADPQVSIGVSISHLVWFAFRVWNGIFAPGDWPAKRGLKTMSSRRDRKAETTTREKWPQKRPFCYWAISCGFAHQGSNLGPVD